MSVMPLIAVQAMGIMYELRTKKLRTQIEQHEFEELEVLAQQIVDDDDDTGGL